MKRRVGLIWMLVVMLVFFLGAVVVQADTVATSNAVATPANQVTFGVSGYDFLALYNGRISSAGVGVQLGRYNRWHTDGLVSVAPANGTQTSLGAGLFYDIPIVHLLTVSPMIGYLFPVSGPSDISQIRPAIGLSLVFNLN